VTWWFYFFWLLSGGFTLLFGVAALTYIRRTLQLMKADEDGSPQERILDGIEELNVRLHGINERLVDLDERIDGLERRLPLGTVMARLVGAPAEIEDTSAPFDKEPPSDHRR